MRAGCLCMYFVRLGVCPSCSLSVGIMFISYAAHTRFHPFLDPMTPDSMQQKHGSRGAIASGMQLLYVRCTATPVLSATPRVRARDECCEHVGYRGLLSVFGPIRL
jgi:hypothetical protein